MNKIFDGVRPTDWLLAIALTALGVLLMVENINGQGQDVRIDSTSWAMVPVFAVATIAVLWRRRSVLAVTLVACAAMAVHVLAFGWVVRCGAGLPLAIALAYAAGRLCDRRDGLVAFAATMGLQVLVLVQDSAAGWGALVLSAPVAVVAWGVGLLVRKRLERPSAPAVDAPVSTYA